MQPANHWGLLIDVDGTMVDNRRYHEAAWIEFGRRHRLPITSEFYHRHIHARGNEEILNFLYPGQCTPEFVRQASAEKENLYREQYRPHLAEIPGLNAFLGALSTRKVPYAAVSNSPKENVDLVLDGLGIRSVFAAVVFREEVAKGKPDPSLYRLAAERMRIPLERCIAMEDSPSGFRAAENARIPFIAITAGADPEAVAQAGRADAVHADFTSLRVEDLEAMVGSPGESGL